ncbi:MAG: 9-O-acetylesterase [Planctomycetes bacterium]|nr:9-O-acetylesterase [Planctomycetota bacterium]
MKHPFATWLRLAALAVLLGWAMGQASAADGPAKPLLHALFTDDMVIQRDVAAPVWGWAAPGAKVSVALTDASGAAAGTYEATADDKGRWEAKVGPKPAGGPYSLTVKGASEKTIKNVLFGDVYICSGQSNMEMGIGNVNNAKDEIAAANLPQIRLYTVDKRTAIRPLDAFGKDQAAKKWLVCSPETVVGYGWGGFSASAFFFGREMLRQANVPVGLLHTSWSGSRAEPWVSEEGLAANPIFKAQVEAFRQDRAAYENQTETFEQRVEKWWKQVDPDNAKILAGEDGDAEWKTMDLPHQWEGAGLPNFDGIVWFRRTVEVPAEWADKELVLSLGPIDDCDVTYVNGKKVGGQDVWNSNRDYKVPAGVFKAGANRVTVRVLDTGGGGGFHGAPAQMALKPADGTGSPLSLAGPWQYRALSALRDLPAYPVNMSNNSGIVTGMYNAMIAPLTPLAVRGAIWYQGESNAGEHAQYQSLLTSLINDWKGRFTLLPDKKFPFGIVMLASFMKVTDQPVEQSAWPFLREAQLKTALAVPDCGIASAVDIGDVNDIHPRNKQEVGRRLALFMLNATGMKTGAEWSGPIYKAMKVEGDKIRLEFSHVGGGLEAKGGAPLKWFAICGADKKFVKADATIDGDAVVVSAPGLSAPVAARYAWANAPEGANLYNKEGLPALPFRTDE